MMARRVRAQQANAMNSTLRLNRTNRPGRLSGAARQRAIFILAQTTFFVASSAYGEDPESGSWPQWRGPSRDSRVAASTPWPDDLSSMKREWRVKLGPGYSGPVVWGNQVFVTETENGTHEVVRSLDRSTGQERWRCKWEGAMSVPFFAKKNGDWIRATPACDGESLYVAGMRDVLVCLDMTTGKERWRVDFADRLGVELPSFGFVSSPLVVGEHVYVQAGGGFIKLNKRTGEIIWRTLVDGGAMNSAFSSPVMATIQGTPQIVVQMRQQLAGVVPESGEVLWSQVVPSFRGMNILTPMVTGDGILTSSYKNKTFFYRIDKDGSSFRVQEAWTSKGQGYMSSPVVIDQHAYLHLGNGRLCCIDLKSGKEKWRTGSFGDYWSMVVNGDRMVALDERGELLLIAADTRAFRLLDRKKVAKAECWAHLAISGDMVLVRDLRGLSAFRWTMSAGGRNSQPTPTTQDAPAN